MKIWAHRGCSQNYPENTITSFEKAMSIIEEDTGTHFDPKVADAFLSARDEVRKVAERFESNFA